MMRGVNKGSAITAARIPYGSVGVELGVWMGASSIRFLEHARHLHLVDPWSVEAYQDTNEFGTFDDYIERYSSIVGSKNPDDFQAYYAKIYDGLKARLQGYPVTFHRCTTDEFFARFQDRVNWVYVDASHSYTGCLKDLQHSREIICPGGSIYADDYGNKQGVTRAIDDFIAQTGLKLDNFHSNQVEIKLPL